jgi:hypothetical protein
MSAHKLKHLPVLSNESSLNRLTSDCNCTTSLCVVLICTRIFVYSAAIVHYTACSMSGQPVDALTVLCTVSRLVTVPLEVAKQHKEEAVKSALLPPVHTDTPWTSSKEVCIMHYLLPLTCLAHICCGTKFVLQGTVVCYCTAQAGSRALHEQCELLSRCVSYCVKTVMPSNKR